MCKQLRSSAIIWTVDLQVTGPPGSANHLLSPSPASVLIAGILCGLPHRSVKLTNNLQSFAQALDVNSCLPALFCLKKKIPSDQTTAQSAERMPHRADDSSAFLGCADLFTSDGPVGRGASCYLLIPVRSIAFCETN